jgi:hypothetical protein
MFAVAAVLRVLRLGDASVGDDGGDDDEDSEASVGNSGFVRLAATGSCAVFFSPSLNGAVVRDSVAFTS